MKLIKLQKNVMDSFFLGLKNMLPGVYIPLKWTPYFMEMR